MVGILIIAHERLGESLIACAAHVLGVCPERLRALAVGPSDDPQASLLGGLRLLREVDSGSGVLVLTDVYGATPANVACRLLVPGHVEGVAGVNLPMLVRAITYRREPLGVVMAKALSGGVEGIMHMPPASLDHAASGN
jgi:mannose PTS system EIIA component